MTLKEPGNWCVNSLGQIFLYYFCSMQDPNIYAEGQVILIDKPFRWTSFDAVRKVRNLVKIKKSWTRRHSGSFSYGFIDHLHRKIHQANQ